ncbi:MAG: hypothetical protein GX434_02945 [Peptococcaceae bacterium]|nr:hypothetical protein [Peptococcaceae bacterium]
MKRRATIAVSTLLILMMVVTGCAAKTGSDKGSTGNQKGKGTGEISVIAKSGNSMTTNEKEAVLNEITKELDEMISSANSFEDIEDSDLN